MWLKFKHSIRARSDSVQVLVQAWSVGRRSVLMLGHLNTDTCALPQPASIQPGVKTLQQGSKLTNQLVQSSQNGSPAQGGYVMMCKWSMVGSSSTMRILLCVRVMQQVNRSQKRRQWLSYGVLVPGPLSPSVLSPSACSIRSATELWYDESVYTNVLYLIYILKIQRSRYRSSPPPKKPNTVSASKICQTVSRGCVFPAA